MTILALMIFAIVKGVKDGARTVLTESTIKTCKSSMDNLYNFIFNESRKNNIEVFQHPLFKKVWPSNKVWTFRDKDETDLGITSNGLMNMINIGNLGIENKSMLIEDVKYTITPMKTLVDGWGNPICLMRNEIPWWMKNKPVNDDIVETIYKDRKKSNVGLYSYHTFNSNLAGKNLYGWNDAGFSHVDSNGVNEPSYEIAPLGNDVTRTIGALMYGQVAVPYNTNDFDFFSAGKDGKIGNLIPNDMMEDRWTEKVKKDATSLSSEFSFVWKPASASVFDPDTDNIISYNKYILE